jgi:hypothetical protein
MNQTGTGMERHLRKDRNRITTGQTVIPVELPIQAEERTKDRKRLVPIQIEGLISDSFRGTSIGIETMTDLIRRKGTRKVMHEIGPPMVNQVLATTALNTGPTSGQVGVLRTSSIPVRMCQCHRNRVTLLQVTAMLLLEEINLNFNRKADPSTGAAVVEKKGHTYDLTAQRGESAVHFVADLVTSRLSVAPRSDPNPNRGVHLFCLGRGMGVVSTPSEIRAPL